MLHVGLDLSSARVALCIMNDEGEIVRQATVASDPAAIAEKLEPYMAEVESVGFEAGPTSAWLPEDCANGVCR